MGIAGNLNPNQLQFFNSEGYLVLESFASPDEIRSLRSRMEQLLDEFDFSSKASIFSTTNQVNIQSCSSAYNYRFFLFQSSLIVCRFLCLSGYSKKRLMITSSKVLRRFHFSLKVWFLSGHRFVFYFFTTSIWRNLDWGVFQSILMRGNWSVYLEFCFNGMVIWATCSVSQPTTLNSL